MAADFQFTQEEMLAHDKALLQHAACWRIQPTPDVGNSFQGEHNGYKLEVVLFGGPANVEARLFDPVYPKLRVAIAMARASSVADAINKAVLMAKSLGHVL